MNREFKKLMNKYKIPKKKCNLCNKIIIENGISLYYIDWKNVCSDCYNYLLKEVK